MENKKFKNCFIHIGVDKTGSTSIQNFFTMNRETFFDHSLVYPPCDLHHGILGSYFSTNPTEFIYNQERMIIDKTMIKDRDNEYFETFEKFIKNQKNRNTLIISYEGFWSLNKDSFSNMKNYFDSLCENVYIIVYVRKPISYAISALSQNIKQGRSVKKLTSHLYYDKLMLLKSIFKSNFIVRVFDKKLLKNNDVVADFFNEIGFFNEFLKIQNKEKIISENMSISLEAVQYGKEFITKLYNNGIRQLMSDEEFQINFGDSITKIPGSKIKLSEEEIAYIKEVTKEDILLMKQEFNIDLNENEEKYLLTKDLTKNSQLIQTFSDVTADIATKQFVKIHDETGAIHIEKDLLQNIKHAQEYSLQISVENKSCQDWLSTEQYPLTVSIQWLTKDRVLANGMEMRVALPVKKLLSNEITRMSVDILSPAQKGDYILFCTLVQEQIKWFNNQKFKAFEAEISV